MTKTVTITLEQQVEVKVECTKGEEGWEYDVLEPTIDPEDWNLELEWDIDARGGPAPMMRLLLDNGDMKQAVDTLLEEADD